VKVDPIHQPISSKKNNPVKPKRIEVDAGGKKWYVYDCANLKPELQRNTGMHIVERIVEGMH